jgi:hypothetical protein
MLFIRSRIVAPLLSESRSVALWKQLAWLSASHTYATCQRPMPVRGRSPSLLRGREDPGGTCFHHGLEHHRSILAVEYADRRFRSGNVQGGIISSGGSLALTCLNRRTMRRRTARSAANWHQPRLRRQSHQFSSPPRPLPPFLRYSMKSGDERRCQIE